MAYGNKYRVQFTNNLGEDYYIFFNLKDYAGDVVFIIATGDALNIKSINNDDDRDSPILSKECEILMFVLADQAVSILDFLAEEDDQWNVVIKRGLAELAIFNGFLIVEDSRQPLQDKPFILTLRASDGLPLLKTIPLSMADGGDFTGASTIVEYVCNILSKINTGIDVRAYYDIRHVSMTTDESPLNQMQVDAKTFSKDEVTFDNCYTVLEKICSDLRCRLFYENGFWHLMSTWQYHKDYGFNYTTYRLSGNDVSKIDTVEKFIHAAKIGKNEVIYAINKDAMLTYMRSSKSVKKTYNYEIPKDLICNQQLKRGNYLSTIFGTFVDDKEDPPITVKYRGIETFCFDHFKGADPVNDPQPAALLAYTKIEYDIFDYERQRYVVLPSELIDATHYHTHMHSSWFYVGKDDRLTVSVEVRLNINIVGVDKGFALVLEAEDFTIYTVRPNGEWTTSSTAVYPDTFPVDMDYTNWLTASVETKPIPKTGRVKIILDSRSIVSAQPPHEAWFKNIRISYSPYIGNSFQSLAGDFNLYSQNKKINKTIEETVYISDSPKKIIKGAIFVNGVLATPEWQVADRTDIYRFTQLMALMKYNFNFRQFQKIEGTLKGLSLFNISEENIPFGFLPTYHFSDIPDQPTTRYILTSMDVDYAAGTWRGVLVEVRLNSLESFDRFDFAYIFQ